MSNEDPIPISALEHHCYCPRQAALILVDHEWVDNAATARGTIGHERVDTRTGRVERGREVLRAVPLWSQQLGLTGRADVIEVTADGGVIPVEYKIGFQHGDSAHVQLCAQALCLEEMTGQAVPVGALWFSATRTRLQVEINTTLRNRTIDVIDEVRSNRTSARLPSPANDERCNTCQLFDRCLPTVSGRNAPVDRYLAEQVYACSS